MPEIDYAYISENIANISRIQIRIYENKSCTGYYSATAFDPDPALPYLDRLLDAPVSISCHITPFYQYYGVIRHERHTMVIGPACQFQLTRSNARELMFLLGIDEKEKAHYQTLLQGITLMPLEIFLHLLCLVNYYISGEKKEITELSLFDFHDSIPTGLPASSQPQPPVPEPEDWLAVSHSTFEYEQQMLRFVKTGNLEGLRKLFANSSAGQPGKIADSYLRQLKNIFITCATTVSRAAIAGGLPVEEALSLSDRYIQHSEKHLYPDQIQNLQYHMVLDYATRIRNLVMGKQYSKSIQNIISYLQEHLTENVHTADLCSLVSLSRSQLSARFKSETGFTITEYMYTLKIKKARDLLASTDKSLLEISTYLGFSSQGYFQNVFRRYTSMTPGDYRKYNRKGLSHQ